MTFDELKQLLLDLADFVEMAAIAHLDCDDVVLANDYATRARKAAAELQDIFAGSITVVTGDGSNAAV